MANENETRHPMRTTCCPCGGSRASVLARQGASCGDARPTGGISRRGFLQGVSGATAFSAALSGLTWSSVAAAAEDGPAGPERRPLVVRPILTYDIPTRHHQTSWRSWGGIQTAEHAEQELARIGRELNEIQRRATATLCTF